MGHTYGLYIYHTHTQYIEGPTYSPEFCSVVSVRECEGECGGECEGECDEGELEQELEGDECVSERDGSGSGVDECTCEWERL